MIQGTWGKGKPFVMQENTHGKLECHEFESSTSDVLRLSSEVQKGTYTLILSEKAYTVHLLMHILDKLVLYKAYSGNLHAISSRYATVDDVYK